MQDKWFSGEPQKKSRPVSCPFTAHQADLVFLRFNKGSLPLQRRGYLSLRNFPGVIPTFFLKFRMKTTSL